jgi:hypothetical protein
MQTTNNNRVVWTVSTTSTVTVTVMMGGQDGILIGPAVSLGYTSHGADIPA